MADGDPKLTLREVGTDEGYRLIEPMLALHYEEIAKFKEVWVIKPDIERYQLLAAAGRLIALVAEVDGAVVGYSVNFLTYNVHYVDTMMCQNDLLYVVPEHRKGRVGLRLMNETIKLAKDRGAKIMTWHAKAETPLNALLPRQGYDVLDVVWAKVI